MMSKIQVLDCTLRDGGYCNNCRFGFDNYRELYFRKVVTYNDEQFNKDIMDIGVEGVVKEL